MRQMGIGFSVTGGCIAAYMFQPLRKAAITIPLQRSTKVPSKVKSLVTGLSQIHIVFAMEWFLIVCHLDCVASHSIDKAQLA